MRIVSAAMGIAFALLWPCFGQNTEAAPWIGIWTLDTSVAENPQYKRITLRIEPAEGGALQVTYDMVGTRGGLTHLEWTGKMDGSDYAVQGLDYVMTNAYTQVDDRSYSILVKVDGVARASTHVSVSADGLTMTAVTTPTAGGGPTTAVYRRKTP